MAVEELNRGALWGAKQTAKGTAATVATKRFIHVAGSLSTSRDQGSEAYSDLGKFGSSTDWINGVSGGGTPGIEATPEELAWLLYMFHGGETVTNVTGPPAKKKHTFVPLPGMGFWGTFWKVLGQTVQQKEVYADCRIGQVVIEGSTANKAVRITPTIMSLDPGAIGPAVNPTPGLPVKAPFLYTDGTGTFTIDGTAFPGQSQFQLTLNDDLQTVPGDDVVPMEMYVGQASAQLGATVVMNEAGLAQFNTLLYGSAAPAAGTKPRKTLNPLGSYSFYLKAKDPTTGAANGDEFKLTIPGVRWAFPEAPGYNPGGGNAELALAGQLRLTQVTTPPPLYTIDVNNDDVAYT